METLKKVRKIFDAVVLTAIVIYFLLMFGFTNGNVITRYLLNRPIVISNEIARYAYVDIIFLGAIYTMRGDGHLSLDFFTKRMPGKMGQIISIGGRILTEVFLVIMTVFSYKMVMANLNNPSTAMQIPMAIPYAPMVVGGIGMFVEELIWIVIKIKELKNPAGEEVSSCK